LLHLFPIVLILIITTIAITLVAKRSVKTKNSNQVVFNGLNALICFALFGYFVYAFYIRFYQWTDCFNKSGRCYDPISQQVYTEAGMFWIIPAFIFFLLGMKRFLHFIGNFC
jgi:glucose uptake protein GlcU